jgi:magnesium transporter
MPEIEWDGGYYVVLGIMFLVASSMTMYFKRKDWI